MFTARLKNFLNLINLPVEKQHDLRNQRLPMTASAILLNKIQNHIRSLLFCVR